MQRLKSSESLISLLAQKGAKSLPSKFDYQPTGFSCVFNTESAWFYYNDNEFRRYVNACDHIFLDGIALKKSLEFRGLNLPRNHGPDVLNDLLFSNRFKNIVVIGGSPATLEALPKALGNTISLFLFKLPMYERLDELDSLDVDLNNFFGEISGGKLVLISLGLPKQERFSENLIKTGHIDEALDLVVPVGAALDFIVGTRIRSGGVWQSTGLEWLPRLIREPRMLPRLARSLWAAFFTLFK